MNLMVNNTIPSNQNIKKHDLNLDAKISSSNEMTIDQPLELFNLSQQSDSKLTYSPFLNNINSQKSNKPMKCLNRSKSSKNINRFNHNLFDNNFEKCCILKIKCKCIQIINRLICLVSILIF